MEGDDGGGRWRGTDGGRRWREKLKPAQGRWLWEHYG